MTKLVRPRQDTVRAPDERPPPGTSRAVLRRALTAVTRERSLEIAIILGPVLLILTSVLIARSIGPTGRGHLVTLTTWAQVMGWTGGLSIDKALMARSADPAAGGGTESGAGRLVLAALGAMLSAGGVAAVLSVAVAQSLLGGWTFLVAMPVAVVGTVAFDIRATLLLLARRWQTYALLRFSQPTAYLCGALVAAALAHWRPGLAVPGFVVAFCASLWLPTLLVGGVPHRIRGTAGPLRLRSLVRFALTYHLGSVLYLLGSRIDLLLMPLYFHAGDIGLYAVAASAGQIVTLLGSANLLRGLTGRSASAGGQDRVGLALALAITVGVALTVGWLLPLAYGGAFVGAVALARFLCVRGLLVYLTQGLIGRLTAAGLPWANAAVNLTGVLTFLALLPIATTLPSYVLAAVTSSAAAWLSAWGLSWWRRRGHRTAGPREQPDPGRTRQLRRDGPGSRRTAVGCPGDQQRR